MNLRIWIFCWLFTDAVFARMSEIHHGIPGNLCMGCGIWDAGPYWCSFCGAT